MSGKQRKLIFRQFRILASLGIFILIHPAASAVTNPAEVPLIWCSLEGHPFPDEPWFEKKTVTVICDGSAEKQELPKDTVVRYLGVSPHIWDPRRGYALPFNNPLGKIANYFQVERNLFPVLSNAEFTKKANAWLNKKYGAAIKDDWRLRLQSIAIDQKTAGIKKSDATDQPLDVAAGASQFHQAVAAWSRIPELISRQLPLGADTKEDALAWSTAYFAPKAKAQPSMVVIQGIVDTHKTRMDLIYIGDEIFVYKHDGRSEYRLELMSRSGNAHVIGDYSVWAEASHMDMAFMGDRVDDFRAMESVVANRPDRRSELVILKPLGKESAEHRFARKSKDQVILELSRRYRKLFDLETSYRSAWKRGLVRRALDASEKLELTNSTAQELGLFWTYISETAPVPRIDAFIPDTFVKEAFDLTGMGEGP